MNKIDTPDGLKPVCVIPREKAVFRLDGQGFWRNAGGRFRLKKVIDYFHAAIDHDENGYYVIHDKGGIMEKVYFPYEDTALFVFDVIIDKSIILVLNTKKRIELKPDNLFSENDALYLTHEGHRIKFAERALMKISGFISEKENRLVFEYSGKVYPLES